MKKSKLGGGGKERKEYVFLDREFLPLNRMIDCVSVCLRRLSMPGHGAVIVSFIWSTESQNFFFLMVGDTCNQCHRPNNIHTLLMQQLYIKYIKMCLK